jgi:nucleotide-binding universal stress UspA family protein
MTAPPDLGRPVLVGVDGSATSGRALEFAALLAERLGVELVVVHALGLLTVIDGEHVPATGRRDEVRAMLEQDWCAALVGRGELTWRPTLVDGSPAEVMLAQADELDAGLVVVGSRGVGSDKLLGSTSHHLVHHCNRPVVVVPPGPPGAD